MVSILVKTIGKDDVECAVIIVELHELVSFHNGLFELDKIVLEKLEVGITK